jgi:hypothetical protein
MKSVEHDTLAMILWFGKRSRQVHAINRPATLWTAALTDEMALTKISPPTGY